MPSKPVNVKQVLLRKRISDEGRQAEYDKLIRHYRNSLQIPLDDVWQVAGASFPPLNGDAIEYTPTETAKQWIDTLGVGRPWEIREEIEAAAAEAPPAEEQPAEVEPQPEATKPKKPRRSCITFEELRKAVGPDRTASELDVVRWVFNHYKVPLDQINVDYIPSVGALGYLEYVNSSLPNYGTFIANAWTKLLPTKQTLEYEQSLKDDGRKNLDLLDEFLRSMGVEEAA